MKSSGPPHAICSRKFWCCPPTTLAMFAKATANFVHQIDPDGSLIPVSRLNDSDKLVPLALVVKHKCSWFWQQPKYQPSGFTLTNLLVGDQPLDSDISKYDFLSFKGRYGDTNSGKVDATAGNVNMNLEGRGSSKLQSSFGNLKKHYVVLEKLLKASNGRRVDMQHQLIQQCQKRAEVFAVLMELILTTTSCCISEQVQEQITCQGVLGLLGRMGKKSVQVCVKENGSMEMDSDVSLEIPPNTVIAYSLMELDIKKDGCFELCLQHGTPGGFEAGCMSTSPSPDLFDSLCAVDGLDCRRNEIPEEAPLSTLQRYLQVFEVYFSQLAVLPVLARNVLYQKIHDILLDRTTITSLEYSLEGLCRGEAVDYADGSQNQSVSALLELLLKVQSDQIPPVSASLHLTATHLLVSALEALPDAALTLLEECSPDVLEALNTLLTKLKVNGQSLPLETLPLPLQDERAFHWAEQFLLSSKVMLRRETDIVWAETGKNPGYLPLVMCIAVKGLSALCTESG
ncbi:hypothetical protein UPYG_G00334170 [Umbra pygmaea]|uniref:Non-syndromic hearing impairment protein 5 n=1 Tax=Umbra pygmaea TaxID=75934 RepID=A0ABD0VXL0_UMBPY